MIYAEHGLAIFDGLKNLVSGMGTSRDKASHSHYVFEKFSDADLEAFYRDSFLAKKIVNIPARDAGREWREWQGKKDQISKIERTEKRLKLRAKVIEALKISRRIGGAAILIGTGDPDPSQPIDLSRVGVSGLKYLTVLPKWALIPTEINRDLTSENYGRPTMYSIHDGTNVGQPLHPSRLALFRGEQVEGSQTLTDGWGDSILQTTYDAITKDDNAAGNASSLMFEAKVDVIRIKNLSANLQAGGKTFEKLLLERFMIADAAKGINGVLMLDMEEEYEQKNANFAGLGDLMDRFDRRVSAAADIPHTRLYGDSASGLNATGKGDHDNYHDHVKSIQELDIEPEMYVLDECLIRSALGSRPEELHFNWRPLTQETTRERADNAEKLMSALEKAERLGLSTEALQKSAVNALTESGAFPGLEAYVDGETAPDDTDTSEAMGDAARSLVTDAAPRTLYVSRKVLNAGEIIKWAEGQGFKQTLPADDLHVTIAFSRKPVDWMAVGDSFEEEIIVAPGGPRLVEPLGESGKAKVLLFTSSRLAWRHEQIKEHGATWDFPEYQPHITISYDPEAPDLETLEPYRGRIVLGPEVFEEVVEDWSQKTKET